MLIDGNEVANETSYEVKWDGEAKHARIDLDTYYECHIGSKINIYSYISLRSYVVQTSKHH